MPAFTTPTHNSTHDCVIMRRSNFPGDCMQSSKFRRTSPLSQKFLLSKGIRDIGNILLVDPESWALKSGIQIKNSGILLTIGIQNPNSTDKDWNPVPGIRNTRRGIQNPGQSSIPLLGATKLNCWNSYGLYLGYDQLFALTLIFFSLQPKFIHLFFQKFLSSLRP